MIHTTPRRMPTRPTPTRPRAGALTVAVAVTLVTAVAVVVAGAPAGAQEGGGPFRITVVDADSGRGVPMVELRTTANTLHITDSAGVVAFDEPGLMDMRVFFHMRSHGYEFPKDGFGFRGFRVRTAPGGSHTVEIRRVNVAERLYRVTGQGIYAESVRLGDDPPIEEPLLNGRVTGQDSVLNAVYGGRLLWFWGDTNRPQYPLGNFSTSGAWSRLPDDGGLDPSVGVNLHYWTDDAGFSRKMCPIEGPGPVWMGGLTVLRDGDGEALLGHYTRRRSLGEQHEHGLARWDDEAEVFRKVRELPLEETLHTGGHPVKTATGVGDDETRWVLTPAWPSPVRVRATVDDWLEPARHQAWTCLQPGTRWNAEQPAFVLDDDGAPVWDWREDTGTVPADAWRRLVRTGRFGAGDGPPELRDVDTGAVVQRHGHTVHWNEHRGRWVAVILQAWGEPSMIGEVWYAEADTPLGPWAWARKVVTHDDYSFYNVRHHPYFDDGPHIFFEGTYTKMFSGTEVPTPRYNYNQVLYRLDVDDERVHLPVAIWRWTGADGTVHLGPMEVARAAGAWDGNLECAFFARVPGRSGGVARTAPGGAFLVEPEPADDDPLADVLVPLWADTDAGGNRVLTVADDPAPGHTRDPRPVGWVWPVPEGRVLRGGGAPAPLWPGRD